MIIQELISAKVAQMTSNGDTFSFLHSEKDWQNLDTDEAVLPSVHLDMPVKVQPKVVTGGAIEQRYICVLTFLYESNLDDDPDQQYETLKLAESAMNQFILLVEDDSINFDTSKNVFGEAYQVIAYPVFDRCVDGIILPFTCVPRNRPNACIPSYSLPIDNCDPATVQSSGTTFSQLIPSGDTFTLQDVSYSFTNTETTVIASGTAEAQSDIIETLPDVTHTDSNGSSVSYPNGKGFVCTPLIFSQTGLLLTSGQTGDSQGRDGDFFTIGAVIKDISGNDFLNNNTDRFCDTSGGTSYSDDIVIDRSTFDVSTGRVLGYQRTIVQSSNDQASAITSAESTSLGTFTSGWKLISKKEFENIQDLSTVSAGLINYTPFVIPASGVKFFFTRNEYAQNTTNFWIFRESGSDGQALKTTTNTSCFIVATRIFTWNGSVLT